MDQNYFQILVAQWVAAASSQHLHVFGAVFEPHFQKMRESGRKSGTAAEMPASGDSVPPGPGRACPDI
jgi:hypothetical protein